MWDQACFAPAFINIIMDKSDSILFSVYTSTVIVPFQGG